MKEMKKLLFALLCLVLVQTVFISGSAVTEVKAATVKSGLKKEKGNYYYYVKGKKITNQWKTIKTTSKGKTTSYKYYFGKNGAAYMAPVPYDKSKYNVLVKKIGGKQYGFDQSAHLVGKGDYVTADFIFYSFTKAGVVDSARTKAVRKAAKYKSDSTALRKLLGKPKKEKKIGQACMFLKGEIAYDLTYASLTVGVCRLNGKEYVSGVYPR